MFTKQYRTFEYDYDSTRQPSVRWRGVALVQMSFGTAQVILDAHSEDELLYRIDTFWSEFNA
jgi:hypothetical protein